ncbi:hypothetical protein HED51_22800 [Ochrobactrum grignonense]|nr:hypothetical protein [Brucella grignonensis]
MGETRHDKQPEPPWNDGRSDETRLHGAAAAGGLALSAPFVKPSWASEHKITVRDPGGPFAEGFKKAFYDPFKAASGIEVVGFSRTPNQPE